MNNKPQLIIKDYFLALPLICFAFFLVINYQNYWPLSASIFKDFFVIKKLQPFDPTVFLKHAKNIFFVILMTVAAKGYGDFILQKFKLIPRHEKEFNIFSFGFGFAIIILITLLIGSFGFLYKTPVLVLIAAGIFLFFTQRKHYPSSKQKHFSILEIIFLLLIAITIFYIIPCVLAPETFYDSLLSNLGVPYKWLQMHKIQSIPYNIYSDVPYNIGILYAINLMFSDASLAKLMNFVLFFLSAYSVFIFASKYSSRKYAIFAMAFFVTTPLVILLATRSGFEMGLTFFEILSVIAALNYFKNQKLSWLVIAGAMNGVALGGKYTSVVSTVAMVFAMLLVPRKNFKQTIKDIFIFVFVAGLVACPWYLRNLINWGNPFVPMVDFWKQSDTMRIHYITGLSQVTWTWKKVLFSPWYIVIGKLQAESIIGFAYIFIFPFLFLFRKIKQEQKFLIVYVLVYLVLGMLTGRAYLRYVAPIFSVISVLYAIYIFNTDSKSIRNLFLIFCLPFFVFNISTTLLICKSNYNPISNILGFMSDQKYLSTLRPSYPNAYFSAADWINKNTDKNAKILLVGDSCSLYLERENINANHRNKTPLVEFVKQAKDSEDLLRIFKKNRITHILLSPSELKRLSSFETLYWNKRDLMLYNDFFDKHMKEIFRTIPDCEIENNGLLSEDKGWNDYFRNALNYIYVYKIVDFVGAEEKKVDSFNLLNTEFLYGEGKRQELFGVE